MFINLKDKYKSLCPFTSEKMSDFSIITGKNGSGKSQLLDLIHKKSTQDDSTVSVGFGFIPEIKKIQSEGIVKLSALSIDNNHLKNILQQEINAYLSLSDSAKHLVSIIIDENLVDVAITGKIESLSKDSWYVALIEKIYPEVSNVKIPQQFQYKQRQVLTRFFNIRTRRLIKIISAISEFSGKSKEHLTPNDFFNTPLHESIMDENDLFTSQIELIFYNYAKRRDTNRRLYFDKQEDGKNNNSISDNEFIQAYPPPWEIINGILHSNAIDFFFMGINKQDFSIDAALNFQLFKRSSNESIPFDGLSSGEKVIIGLILKLFATQYYNTNLTFPEMLILDEPDSHLHPEMSKLLLDVLEKTFVEEFGIKVIITTHSPSTIALAKEDNIFQLTNGIKTELKKVTKDHALNLLTSFIPTLSIDYRTHRQVFVESPTDVTYYRLLHDKHSQQVPLNHKLYFISNAAGKGNCSLVYSIVDQIRNSGNATSYGIVDWDLKNKEERAVYVHGIDEKYSIENFILDPIYIICLLIDTNNAHSILERVGLTVSDNQYTLGFDSEPDIQERVKVFFSDWERKFPADKYDSEKNTIEYLNGRKIEIPKWYLKAKGHDLQIKLLQVYPALEGKYSKKEGELQSQLSIIMSKCYPYVPKTSIELLTRIAT